MDAIRQTSLGRPTDYPDSYDPALLFPIAREQSRAETGIDASTLHGEDLWTGYELSWLDPDGKPNVALVHMAFPCGSPALIESKSLKLYLNSFAMSHFDSARQVRARIAADLGAASGAGVRVSLVAPWDFAAQRITELAGVDLDEQALSCQYYAGPKPDLLGLREGAVIEETLCSQLLRSNCPVTGQPDWASVQIRYHGAPIDHAGLLRYLVSYRQHSGFHEQCVERIFADIMQRCRPQYLRVYARYTRRGGLDINPWRSNRADDAPESVRGARQ